MFLFNTEIDSGFYTLKFDSLLLKEAAVEADGIIPPLREQHLLSSESDSDEPTNGDDVAYARGAFNVRMSEMTLKLCVLLSDIYFVSLFFCQKFWTMLKNSQLR